MLSSSDPLAGLDEDGPRLLGRLLEAIAHECALLGNEIARLGDVLSIAPALDNAIVEFQAFDFLAQNAHAQAGLIAYAARLASGENQAGEMPAQVENVPLPEVRRRLGEALGLPQSAITPAAHEETSFWFHEDACPSDATAS